MLSEEIMNIICVLFVIVLLFVFIISRYFLKNKNNKNSEKYSGIYEDKSISLSTCKVFCGIEMVKIPSGQVPTFWMSNFQVTQEQYESIMGYNPSYFEGNKNNPVEKINWYSAIEFCNKLSIKAGFSAYYNIDKFNKDLNNPNDYDDFRWTVTRNGGSNGFRLPTSKEWEYACLAGSESKYYWGDSEEFEILNQYAVYDKNSESGTMMVGSKKPNAWGLFDMSGNVWEFCFDRDPDLAKCPCSVIRGGSWLQGVDKLTQRRVEYYYPSDGSYFIGFRLSRNP